MPQFARDERGNFICRFTGICLTPKKRGGDYSLIVDGIKHKERRSRQGTRIVGDGTAESTAGQRIVGVNRDSSSGQRIVGDGTAESTLRAVLGDAAVRVGEWWPGVATVGWAWQWFGSADR